MTGTSSLFWMSRSACLPLAPRPCFDSVCIGGGHSWATFSHSTKGLHNVKIIAKVDIIGAIKQHVAALGVPVLRIVVVHLSRKRCSIRIYPEC